MFPQSGSLHPLRSSCGRLSGPGGGKAL
jgi:hypothetical protein